MLRKAWLFSFILSMLLVSQSLALPAHKAVPEQYRTKIKVDAAKIINPTDEMRVERFSDLSYQDLPHRDEALIGEETIIGYTWYDYQHNGSIGKMIARDSDGGIHVVWMCGYNSQQNPRHMLYNFMDEDGNWLAAPEERTVIDNGTRSGYGVIAILPDDNRGMPIYHVLGHREDDANWPETAMSADWLRGIGAFQPFYPPGWNQIQLLWPKGVIDRGNFAHIMSTENGDVGGERQIWQRVAYWRGTPNDGFDQWGWTDPAVNVDTAGVISAVVAASSQSNRVAAAWHHNRVGSELGAWAEAPGYWQRNNDIVYQISQDGRNWDWRRRRSMTKIIAPIPELAEFDMDEAYGDTFRPYTDVDLAFDPWDGSDQLYATFATCGFWEEPVPDDDPEPADGATGEHDVLWFWNAEQDTITLIYHAWYFNRTDNGGWKSRAGAWRMNADRGSIAFDPENPGHVYVVWVNFPMIMHVVGEGQDARFEYLDNGLAQDTSEAGYKNAEIMVSFSDDYGITWHEPVNITETIWEGQDAPAPGECASENWPSVATIADGQLHITYVRDTDAGGIPQNEGTATNSPVIYHNVPLEDLPETDVLAMPRQGFQFHNYVDNRPQVPLDEVRRNPAMPVPNNVVDVTATAMGGGNAEITEVWLQYRVNGGNMLQVQMEDAGQENSYVGSIPGQAAGANVWYRIRAVNDVGLESVVPADWWFAYVVRPAGQMRIRDVQYRPADWANDYSPYRGYEVTLTGITTTPADYANVYGAYAIQDAEEGWSGVYVRGIQQALEVGTRIRVTGMVMERDPDDVQKWQYQTYIQVRNVEVLGAANAINALPVSVDDLRFATRAEELEGVLIEVNDIAVDTLTGSQPRYWPIEDPQSGAEGWFTTIGLTDAVIRDLNIAGYRQGTTISSLVGVFSENFGYYAISPRGAGDFGEVGVRESGQPSPYKFALNSVYPNPFNAVTRIGFDLAETGMTHLAVYDLSGRLVATIADGVMKAGHYDLNVDASSLSSGVYMLRLEAAGNTAARKLVLVK